jgi:hypothetical protein
MPTTQGIEMHMEYWHLLIYINEGGNLNFLCFCLSCWSLPKPKHILLCTIGTIGKSLTNRGALVWFPNVLTYGEKVIENWINFSLKIHLNQNSKNYWGIWAHFWLVLESSLWVRFNDGDLENFKPKVREILKFE